MRASALIMLHKQCTDRRCSVEPTKPATKSSSPVAGPKSSPIKTEPSALENAQDSELDAMFARLNTGGSYMPSSSTKVATPGGPEASEFSFEDRLGTKDTAAKTPTIESPATPAKAEEKAPNAAPVVQEREGNSPKEAKKAEKAQDISQKDLEQLYMQKAAEYVSALPAGKSVSVQTIKTVSGKLRNTYAPDAKLSAEEADKLKARFVFAIVNYINQVLKETTKPVKADDIKKALQQCGGNLLALCGALVDKGHLPLNDLESITGLFKMILDILPKPEPTAVPTAAQAKPSTAVESKSTSKDPIDSMKAWPAQEKREARKSRDLTTQVASQLQKLTYPSRPTPCLYPEGRRGCEEHQRPASSRLGRPARVHLHAFSRLGLRSRQVPDAGGL